MPTSGETSEPKRKPDAPKRAEAVPALFRAASMAAAVDTVKIIPSPKHKINNNPSKNMIEALTDTTNISPQEQALRMVIL